MAFGLFHGVVFLPTLLSLCGPSALEEDDNKNEPDDGNNVAEQQSPVEVSCKIACSILSQLSKVLGDALLMVFWSILHLSLDKHWMVAVHTITQILLSIPRLYQKHTKTLKQKKWQNTCASWEFSSWEVQSQIPPISFPSNFCAGSSTEYAKKARLIVFWNWTLLDQCASVGYYWRLLLQQSAVCSSSRDGWTKTTLLLHLMGPYWCSPSSNIFSNVQ